MNHTPRIPREFPDYDLATLPALLDGMEDVSWHNDICPSFRYGSLLIFIDYAETEDRECPDQDRYTVLRLDADGCVTDDGPALITDEWRDVLAFINAQTTPFISSATGRAVSL